MHREEWSELGECVVCGEAVSLTTDRAYALADRDCLCFRCATERGGVYDEKEDRWKVAPNSGDLPDERRPVP
jgi:hypothetical protein